MRKSLALNIDKINTFLWSLLTVESGLKHPFESVLEWRTKGDRACLIPHFLSVSALDRANKIQSIIDEMGDKGEVGKGQRGGAYLNAHPM